MRQLAGCEMPKKHTKSYGVYLQYNERNVRCLVDEFDHYIDALKLVVNNYKYEDGMAVIYVSDSENKTIYIKAI
jgi:hypothetical protein